MRNRLILSTALVLTVSGHALAQSNDGNTIDAIQKYQLTSGFATQNDGTFNYQGVLKENGEPANGMYTFQVIPYTDADGFDIAHELYFESSPIEVVDGLFSLDIEMGGSPADAKRFWREIGDQPIYLEIGVGVFEGGPYTTLGSRSKVGWSARAQYSGITESLRFPYLDSYTDIEGDPVTLISLTSTFGGTILEAIAGDEQPLPIISVESSLSSGTIFGPQTGAVHINAAGRPVGLLSTSDQFAIAGVIEEVTGDEFAAIIGQVNPGVPFASAIYAINGNSGTNAWLATETVAGFFGGDVIVSGNIKKGYGGESASAAPLAYGFITSSGNVATGTGNLSSVWDAANSRYLLTIDNENYFYSMYTAVATLSGGDIPYFVSVGSFDGQLTVYILDPTSGFTRTQSDFQIVIYKPDPNTTVINRNTTGMDDTEFYRINNLVPELIRSEPPAMPEVQPILIGE